MKLAAFIFDEITLLDLIGPLEVLQRLPNLEIELIGQTMDSVSTSIAEVRLAPQKTLSDIQAVDILLLPGGFGTRTLVEDEALLSDIRRLHENTQWTVSICTGSLLLAAAGLLKGKTATTHWNAADQLEAFGAHYSDTRVIQQDKIITAAGVSSGIDMALTLAAKIAGEQAAQAIQLSIEYDPQPPFDSGSPQKAGDQLVALVKKITAKKTAEN